MGFDKSRWADTDFSRDYLDKAEIYIVQRSRMFSIVKSFYIHFLPADRAVRLLELGSGDGALTHELLKTGRPASVTLVDGSADMLLKAEMCLKEFDLEKLYVHRSFEEILNGEHLPAGYDMVVSSMAIHHLDTDEKAALYNETYDIISPGGYFLNVDVIVAPTDSIEGWYMEIWKDWMREKQSSLGVHEPVEAIIDRYKNLGDNKPDTLKRQLDMLKASGFTEPDCYYKYGIFTIFGGKK